MNIICLDAQEKMANLNGIWWTNLGKMLKIVPSHRSSTARITSDLKKRKETFVLVERMI